MTALNKRPGSVAIVRFQDCDPYGHLYNAKYIDYFMNAREDQLIEHYGLDIYDIGSREGLGWVVAQNQIAYLIPAMLMEKVWITSRLIRYSDKTITVEMVMYNLDKTKVKSIMWCNFVHFDIRQRKSLVHADHYKELFQQVHDPVDEIAFEDRVKKLRIESATAV